MKDEVIEVNGTEVKVKTPSVAEMDRPDFFCKACNIHFPSELDLEQHKKIDHAKKISAA